MENETVIISQIRFDFFTFEHWSVLCRTIVVFSLSLGTCFDTHYYKKFKNDRTIECVAAGNTFLFQWKSIDSIENVWFSAFDCLHFWISL